METPFGKKCQTMVLGAKVIALKYALKFQQKCWQNRTTAFLTFTLCWSLCRLSKQAADIDWSWHPFHKKNFWRNFSRSFCKLDHFVIVNKLFLQSKMVQLTKQEQNTPKFLYQIDSTKICTIK